ncbi:MAG: YkvA family protein [Sarcina sp.]
MNISRVKVDLSGEDIKSIINDFVKVQGLTITNIKVIENNLVVEGSFKKILSLGFKAQVQITKVENNIITIKLKKVSLMKIGIMKVFRKIALKMALKGFKEKGILLSSDEINIDISVILEGISLINFILADAKIEKGFVSVTVEEIDLLLSGIISDRPKVIVSEKVELDEDVLTEEEKEDYILNLEINKIEDAYTTSREKVVEKIPEKVKDYSNIIMFLPDIIALIARLFKDSRVSKKTKIILAMSLGYTAIPLDILPDKIPILGKIDDIAIILFALNRMIEDVPIEILLENWQGSDELVFILKGAVEYLVNFTGAKNINRIYEVIEALT